MLPEGFWWNWWVQVAVAVGTIGAVTVGLYSALKKPKPRLLFELLRREGERTNVGGEDVRYYHLKVWNEKRWIPADDVQVIIMEVEDLRNHRIWRGNLPLNWRDQGVPGGFVSPLQRVGSEKHADLCRVGALSGLLLLPMYFPNNFQHHYPGDFHLILTVQARSNQTDSEPMKVEIRWNGVWNDDHTKMDLIIAVGQRLRL